MLAKEFDLDIDPITLVLKLDPDMVKMLHHTKNEVSMSSFKIARTGRHTHRQHTKTLPSHIRGRFKKANVRSSMQSVILFSFTSTQAFPPCVSFIKYSCWMSSSCSNGSQHRDAFVRQLKYCSCTLLK